MKKSHKWAPGSLKTGRVFSRKTLMYPLGQERELLYMKIKGGSSKDLGWQGRPRVSSRNMSKTKYGNGNASFKII
jgi:hypothetical protein